MKKNWKSIALFAFLSPFLAEVITQSTPAGEFFRPGSLLIFMTLAYGFPLLVIREISVRQKYGLFSLLSLGMLYGLYNEGMLARTLFHPFDLPMETIANYGLVGNIRLPWLFLVALWHAMTSLLFPLVFVNYLWPKAATVPWLSKKAAWILGILSLGIATIAYFSPSWRAEKIAGDPKHFLFLIFLASLFYFVASKLRQQPHIVQESSTNSFFKLFGIGIGLTTIFVILPMLFSGLSIPVPFTILYFVVLFVLCVRRIKKLDSVTNNDLAYIGLGSLAVHGAILLFK